MNHFKQCGIWLKEMWCNGTAGTNDFYKGMIVAAGGLILLMILLKFFHLIIRLCRRNKRCSIVTLQQQGGNISVSVSAISAAVISELEKFRQLEIRKVLLYKNKEHYIVTIRGTYHAGNNDEGVGKLAEELKAQLSISLKKLLGLDNVSEINLLIENFEPAEKDESENKYIPGGPILPISADKPVQLK